MTDSSLTTRNPGEAPKQPKIYAVLRGIDWNKVEKALDAHGAAFGETGKDGVTEIITHRGCASTLTTNALTVAGVRSVALTRNAVLRLVAA